VNRGHIVLSGGKPGHGARPAHTPLDVLQARLLVKLGRVGVPPHRAAMFWPVLQRPLLAFSQGLLLLSPREDGSDTDFRVVLPGDSPGWDMPDAPGVMAVINLAALKRDVMTRLVAMRSAARAH